MMIFDLFRMRVRYSTAADEYYRGIEDEVTPGSFDVKGWRNGVHSMTSVFRKEELDWKMVSNFDWKVVKLCFES